MESAKEETPPPEPEEVEQSEQIEPSVKNESKQAESDKHEEPPKEEEAPPRDWYQSGVHKLVLELMALPKAGQREAAKRLETEFCNPDKLDIFTEDEAGYNASLLRQKGINNVQAAQDEAHDDELLEALYHKATRTVELLSEHVLLSTLTQEEIMAAVQEALLNSSMVTREAAVGGSSIVLAHEDYKKVGVDTVIKLLLRCKKLYLCLQDVKKLLQLIVKQEELFKQQGLIYCCLQQYDSEDASVPLADKDDAILKRGLQSLMQVSRRITYFLDDHLIYKHFIFNGNEHQQTLLKHARKLWKFAKKRMVAADGYEKIVKDI